MAAASPAVRAMSPARFAEIASRGQWVMRPHLEILNRRMIDLAARKIRKQAAFMPPRHGKSEFRTKYFPAWYLGTRPTHRVILACNTANLADDFGEMVRDLLEEWGEPLFGVKVRQDRRAAGDWKLEQGGGMFCVGVGGALAGRGANLFLIDDPIKTPEEALNPSLLKKQADWFSAAARTRLEPDGVMALTATPWHSLDLSGRVMSGELKGWDILKIPALAEEDDVLGRAPGEALWPERYPAEALEEARDDDPFWFEALYQCRPRPRDGTMFKAGWFDGKVVAGPPPDVTGRVRFWDRAATLGAGDWTAGVKMSAGADGLYYVEHVDRFRLEGHERNARMRQLAGADGPGCLVRGEQEPAAAGKAEVGYLSRGFAGFDVGFAVASGNKEVRAAPFASQCQAGNVRIVAGEWNAAYIAELTGFPGGKHDDQVDASSGAFNELAAAEGCDSEWGVNPFAGARY